MSLVQLNASLSKCKVSDGRNIADSQDQQQNHCYSNTDGNQCCKLEPCPAITAVGIKTEQSRKRGEMATSANDEGVGKIGTTTTGSRPSIERWIKKLTRQIFWVCGNSSTCC